MLCRSNRPVIFFLQIPHDPLTKLPTHASSYQEQEHMIGLLGVYILSDVGNGGNGSGAVSSSIIGRPD